jgi:hypothetical protein
LCLASAGDETQSESKWLNRLHREGVAMKVMFTCQTCGSPVEYEIVSTETHALRRYGVHRYVCVQPCLTCSVPEPSHDSFTFEPAEEPRSISRLEFRPIVGILQEAARGSV